MDRFGAELEPLADGSLRELVARALEEIRYGALDEATAARAWRYLEHLGPDDIAPALELVDGVESGYQPFLKLVVLSRWAQFDAAASIEFAERQMTGELGEILVMSAFPRFVNEKPSQAYDWVMKRRADGMNAIGGFMEDYDGLEMIFESWGRLEVGAAVQKLDQLAAPKERRSAIGGLAKNAGEAAVLQALEALPDIREPKVRDRIARSWGEQDPRAAIAWLVGRAPAEEIVEAVGSILDHSVMGEFSQTESLPDDLRALLEERRLDADDLRGYIDALEPDTP